MEENREKYFYSPSEFRHVLGCGRHLCYEMLRTRKIKSFKLGSKIFIPASEIDRLGQVEGAESKDTEKDDFDF